MSIAMAKSLPNLIGSGFANHPSSFMFMPFFDSRSPFSPHHLTSPASPFASLQSNSHTARSGTQSPSVTQTSSSPSSSNQQQQQQLQPPNNSSVARSSPSSLIGGGGSVHHHTHSSSPTSSSVSSIFSRPPNIPGNGIVQSPIATNTAAASGGGTLSGLSSPIDYPMIGDDFSNFLPINGNGPINMKRTTSQSSDLNRPNVSAYILNYFLIIISILLYNNNYVNIL